MTTDQREEPVAGRDELFEEGGTAVPADHLTLSRYSQCGATQPTRPDPGEVAWPGAMRLGASARTVFAQEFGIGGAVDFAQPIVQGFTWPIIVPEAAGLTFLHRKPPQLRLAAPGSPSLQELLGTTSAAQSRVMRGVCREVVLRIFTIADEFGPAAAEDSTAFLATWLQLVPELLELRDALNRLANKRPPVVSGLEAFHS